MAENPTPPGEATPPAREPYGPGVLMVLGLFCLIVAAWCGNDYFNPKEEWVKTGQQFTIGINGVGMVAGAAGAIYAFVLAALRARKGQGKTPGEAPNEDRIGRGG